MQDKEGENFKRECSNNLKLLNLAQKTGKMGLKWPLDYKYGGLNDIDKQITVEFRSQLLVSWGVNEK